MSVRTTGATCAATVALMLAVAAPASAAELGKEGGFTYVKKSANLADTTASDPTGKQREAKCPDGSAPTGGGASVSGDPFDSFVSASGPRQKSWLGGGWHQDSPAGKLTTWGICTEKKSKVRVSSDVVNVAGGASGTAAISCGNDKPVSGGVRPKLGVVEWWLNRSAPQDDIADPDIKPDDTWQSSIWHLPGFFPPVDVSIDAVCMEGAKVSYKVLGVAFTTNDLIELTVECPRKKSVVGGGPDVSGPASQSHVAVTEPFDSDDKGKVPDDGWSISVANPTMAEMDVVVFAACV